ncbi:MAG: glycerol-3-phosphate dehydrogenase/oxidase [Nitrospirae bacterium]|nr:glycerol-3-phosphate dehydrogenase/oxidase [Nitrospirota bacterium]NTW66064.1 glycerol-3-phosphate dehydrogenase/oxidase [Nitrospirota bacterium]
MASDQVFDIIVIGGGITGAGVARDAALRGLSALLLEKRDYASGVSSKTTRLVHGGLRYLANFEVDLVAEALRERAILRKQAPYLITPMPILIPIYKGDPHGRAAISVGIHLYELLSREKDIPHYFTAGADRTLLMEPRLNQDGLKGSALFYDHQIILPERLVIENIISARDAGAKVLNYTAAEKITETGDGVVVTARDTLSGTAMTCRARVLVNASGPWVDDVRKAGGIDRTKIIYPTKGIHLIMPKLSEQSLFIASRDGRMFFIIPLDRWSLIGTTDTKYDGDLDEVHANASDVDYLLHESRRILPGLHLTKDNILYTYAGVRPLAFAGERESRISRKHRVVVEGRTGRIITIAGGKYTTYRNMAEDVMDAACRKLGKKVACETGRKPLAGSLPAELGVYLKEEVPQLAKRFNAAPETVRHLVHMYGSRAEKVLQLAHDDPRLAEAVSPESRDIYAQVLYGIREEGAKTISDIVLRRMHLGITSSRGGPHAAKIAETAALGLGWSNDEKKHWVEKFAEDLAKEKRF